MMKPMSYRDAEQIVAYQRELDHRDKTTSQMVDAMWHCAQLREEGWVQVYMRAPTDEAQAWVRDQPSRSYMVISYGHGHGLFMFHDEKVAAQFIMLFK